MALTNALLKSMGIENDQRDQIMSEHQATLESIKAERDELRDKAAMVPDLERQVNELKSQMPTEDWKAKYEEEKANHDADNAAHEKEKADREKASLYRAALREAGISERHLDSVMKVTDLENVGVVDGALADPDAVKEAIVSEWGDFIPQTTTHGAKVDNPPRKADGGMTKDEIMAVRDTQERQRLIAENIDQFR